MNDKTWDELLMAYLTNMLSEEDRADFDRYLAECEPCRDELREWQTIASAVRSDSEARIGKLPVLPAAFYQRLGVQPSTNGSHTRFEQTMEENMTTLIGNIYTEKRKRNQSKPVTLAAAVVAVILGGLLLIAGGGPNPVQELPLAGVVQQGASATPTAAATASLTFTPTPLIVSATFVPSASAPSDLDPMMLTATQIMVDVTGTAAVEMGLPTPVPPIDITATPIPANITSPIPPTVVPPASSGMQPIVSAPARLAGEVEVSGGIREQGIVTSADGQYIAVRNGDHAVQVFAADTLELAATIDLPDTAVTTLAFGGSRSLLAIGTAGGDVQFWSPDEPQPDTLQGSGVVAGLAFRSDGQSLAIIRNAGSINTLWLFNRDTGEQTAVLVYDVPLASAVFSADGSQIVVGTLDGRVLVLDVEAQ